MPDLSGTEDLAKSPYHVVGGNARRLIYTYNTALKVIGAFVFFGIVFVVVVDAFLVLFL